MLKIDLTGKVALVTGGSGELGHVMCRTLADCGAKVAVHCLRNRQKAEQVAADIRSAGGESMVVQADVASLESVMAMKEAVVAAFGAPDIIVNNAVSQYTWVSVLDQPVEDYRSQFESCVLHNVNMAKAFVPAMTAQRWGRVIALSTECVMQCTPSQSAYVSGKRGMDGVLRVLAREIGESQVTVNQVAPGWMISDKVRTEHTEKQESYEQNVPLKRRGTDQEIANVVAFLASDLASFITGAYVPVCGGNVMPCM